MEVEGKKIEGVFRTSGSSRIDKVQVIVHLKEGINRESYEELLAMAVELVHKGATAE